jgi:hypothetical protein
MKRSPRPTRRPSTLSESVIKQLNMYAIAAGAAGVSLLALAQPAEAKIVYTPAHVKVAAQSRYGIDLDHDGTPDIYLGRAAEFSRTFLFASGDPNLGNGVAVTRGTHTWALAIFPGARIGAARHFAGKSYFPDMATGIGSRSYQKWRGPWANGGKGLKNRYLGIRFKSGGQFHYGWARVTVTIDNRKHVEFSSVVLTGYAYDTIPNKPIIAGKTKGPDEIGFEEPDATLTMPTREPASLGLLAMGASGLSIWRREESVTTTPERN